LHESGHLAAAVVLDLEPTRAELTLGNRHQAGAVYWRLGDITPEMAIRIAKMTLAGPAMGDDEIPSWPLSRTKSSDEKLVSIITDHLDFDEPKYDEMCDQVWDLTFSRPFQRAFIASETLLRQHRVIDREGIAIVEWAAETAKTEAERELEPCAA
jgi:hypothetical protein